MTFSLNGFSNVIVRSPPTENNHQFYITILELKSDFIVQNNAGQSLLPFSSYLSFHPFLNRPSHLTADHANRSPSVAMNEILSSLSLWLRLTYRCYLSIFLHRMKEKKDLGKNHV
jgi:hypothetical protein